MASEALIGIVRSLRIYHGDPHHGAAMDRLYRTYLRPGDLVFDIGSHVGDRVSSFRRLGARVIALEPQPLAFRALRLIHGRDRQVTLRNAACGDRPGDIALRINARNPTVSTASSPFIAAADGASGWEGQQWTTCITVPCTTLDRLIACYGLPQFTKIDVEGFEAAVLAGLSQPLPALSFEFTTIQRAVACHCLDRLTQLGRYSYNVALGESQRLEFDQPRGHSEVRQFIDGLPHAANSGDVYAVLEDA